MTAIEAAFSDVEQANPSDGNDDGCEALHAVSAAGSGITPDQLADNSRAVLIDSIKPHPKNARVGNVDVIRESLRRHGQYRTIVVQASTGFILAGNHTWKAAKAEGWTHIGAVEIDVDATEAERILLMDNRSAELGAGYDDRLLAELLSGLPDLTGTGYENSDLDALLEGLGDALLDGEDADSDSDADSDADPDEGSLLAVADVSVAEPTRSPALGSRWKLGKHLLVVARVADQHDQWRGDLEGRVLAPYPEPYITLTVIGAEKRLLLVQPNRYLAGHLLDKHEAAFPGTVQELPA